MRSARSRQAASTSCGACRFAIGCAGARRSHPRARALQGRVSEREDVTWSGRHHHPAGRFSGISIPVAARSRADGARRSTTSIRSCRCTWRSARWAWSVSTNFILFAIPLFVLLGEILLRSGIAERMYDGDDALAVLAAGRADALEHRHLHAVCRGVGLERRDRGDDRHRGDRADRKARLQRAALSRHHRRRRHARHPHSAVDPDDRLRRADRHLDPAALSRRLVPGLVLAGFCSWSRSSSPA